MTKHKKHIKLPLRTYGHFGINEIAVLGSSCGVISTLVSSIAKQLNHYQLAYVDASHTTENDDFILNQYTFHQNKTLDIHQKIVDNPFEIRLNFTNTDLVFINGNHYQGKQQIVLLDPQKEASLLKRIDQLTDVLCFIKLDQKSQCFDFLSEKIPNIDLVPIFEFHKLDKISDLISSVLQQKKPILNGLVLVGGKSKRMGTDKSSLAYHGTSQRKHLFGLLKKSVIGDVFISSRKEQDIHHKNLIPDTFLGLGPLGGICSAFLVVATDLPFVSDELLNLLISKRNPSKIATTFIGKNNLFPEPLITIWEPKAYPIILQFLAMGYSCPRKVLINSEVEMITIDEHFIRNINTPEEFEAVKKELNG